MLRALDSDFVLAAGTVNGNIRSIAESATPSGSRIACLLSIRFTLFVADNFYINNGRPNSFTIDLKGARSPLTVC